MSISDITYNTETSYDEFFSSRNIRTRSGKDLTHKVWWNNSNSENSKIKTNYYFLNEDENINFLKQYLQSISKKELKIGVYTKCGYNKPLYIQFSMKYTSSTDDDIHDNMYDFMKVVSEQVCLIINNKFLLSEDKTEFISVITFPKKQRKGEYNFRIIFPYFWTNREEITRNIIPTLRKVLQSTNAYKLLTVFPSNEQNMLGSISDDFLPLYMTNEEGIIYNDYLVFENGDEIDINDVFILENCIDELMDVNIEDQNQKIALFTSIYYWKKPTPINKNANNLVSPALNVSASSSITDDGNQVEPMSNSDLFDELYKYICADRKSKLWFIEDMASILKSIYPDQESFNKWKSLFPNCSIIPDIDEWEKYNNEKLTINTIFYYAQYDGKEKFKEWYYRTHLYKALYKAYNEPYDANIARAFKIAFPWQFVCVSHKNSSWYYFSNKHCAGIWYEMDNDVDLINKISGEFFELFNSFKEQEEAMANKNGAKKFETKYEKLSKILLSTGSKRSIISELKSIYHNKEFLEFLDCDGNMTATTNMVIDIRNDRVYKRDGRPEDYISFSTGIPYCENPNGMNDLKTYLKQLFVDKGIRKYVKLMLASLLTSGNKDKIFPIFTGEGNNSKSVFVSIIEKALGKYSGKIPTSLLTGKRTQSSAATPELNNVIKCRVVVAQEPSKEESLNIGLIKELTGNDTLYTRKLFQSGEVSKVNSLLILVCNRIPKIPDNQEAIWERIRVVPFKSKWVSEDKDVDEEQRRFKKDKYFETKTKRLSICLFKVMVDKYPQYKKHGLTESIEMLAAVKHLRDKTNVYSLFLEERIYRYNFTDIEYNDHFITTQELHQSFSAWYKLEYKGNKVPTRTTFIDEIEAILQCKIDGNKIFGLKWKILENNPLSDSDFFNIDL